MRIKIRPTDDSALSTIQLDTEDLNTSTASIGALRDWLVSYANGLPDTIPFKTLLPQVANQYVFLARQRLLQGNDALSNFFTPPSEVTAKDDGLEVITIIAFPYDPQRHHNRFNPMLERAQDGDLPMSYDTPRSIVSIQ